MRILQHVETLKNRISDTGDYRRIAQESGVNYHWLQKFACGAIHNPSVKNVAKLESYLMFGESIGAKQKT